MNECGFPVTTQLQCLMQSAGLTMRVITGKVQMISKLQKSLFFNVCNCIAEPHGFLFYMFFYSLQLLSPLILPDKQASQSTKPSSQESNQDLLVAQPPCHPQWHRADPLCVAYTCPETA